MDPGILSGKSDFLACIEEKLGATPIDFCEKTAFIRQNSLWSAAGVLIPLAFRPESDNPLRWHLLLTKRSPLVPQAGDLGCPGGMLDRKDFIFRYLTASKLFPALKGKARAYALKRGGADFNKITLFLTTALRESWEEIHLNPFHVRYLGPLPCRKLITFTKIIFPVVGFAAKPWLLYPNHEVEKIIEVPLWHFFQPENYAWHVIETLNPSGDSTGKSEQSLCFIRLDEFGQEEILWGATFSIIMNFLKIIFDYDPPVTAERLFRKTLNQKYLKSVK